jgi:hypothetical protein
MDGAWWNSAQGMGYVYAYNGAQINRVFLRGGNWNNGTYAGGFTLNLNWGAATQNNNVGFRCARSVYCGRNSRIPLLESQSAPATLRVLFLLAPAFLRAEKIRASALA